MRSAATVFLMVGMVLIGFPLTEIFVWACAIVGAFVFSNLATGFLWKLVLREGVFERR